MLFSEYDLNNFFNKDNYEVFTIGDISLPTGEIVICDAVNNFGIKNNMINPFINRVDPGEYAVTVSKVNDKKNKGKYAAIKIDFNKETPVIYELAIKYGDVLRELNPGEKYGFSVGSHIICICDKHVEALYEYHLNDWEEKNKNKSLLNEYFLSLLSENSEKNPKCTNETNKWLVWNLPDTEFKIPIISSEFSDGFYSCYWGLDKNDEVCNLVIQFLKINEG